MKVEPDPLVPDVYSVVRGKVYIRQTRWGAIAQKWPAKRGKTKHAGQLWRQIEFGQIAAATKNVIPQDYETAVVQTRESNYVPRDFLMLAMMGSLFEIVDETGTVWKGWRYLMDNVQDVLEQLTNTPGAIIVRGTTFWEWIGPGNEGDILTMIQGTPAYRPNAGPAGSSTARAYGLGTPVAPVPTLFSAETDSAGVYTKIDHADFGFNLEQTGTSGFKVASFGRAAPAGAAWSLITGMRFQSKPNAGFLTHGIYLRKTGNARYVLMFWQNSTATSRIVVGHANSATSYSADVYSGPDQGAFGGAPIWFRVDLAAGVYTFSFSLDRLSWIPLFSESATAWLPSIADRIGYFVYTDNASAAFKTALTCFDWQTF